MAQSVEQVTQRQDESDLHFDSFRLESNKRLWLGAQLIDLRPQALAVLRYLAERPGQLVTRAELLAQLLPGTYVTKSAIRACVHAIRKALNEGSDTQVIETVSRQGYRFIASILTPPPSLNTQVSIPNFVGRERELALLHTAFTQAQGGEQQLILLLGEPGIGKTTLVDRFLHQVETSTQVRIGRGQWSICMAKGKLIYRC